MVESLRHFADIFVGTLIALGLAAQSFVAGHIPTRLASLPKTSLELIASSSVPAELNLFPAAPQKTTSPAKPAPAPAEPAAKAPPSERAPIPETKTADEVNAAARAALVNVFCTTLAGGDLYPISGSGVFVSSQGVILTNAHVGQYFLLRDYLRPDNIDCVIRTGSPASPLYRAHLLYLPPAWVDANASQIAVENARGTGENDYAFLLVTGTTSGAPLPASFPALSLTLDTPEINDPVLLAAYPAGYIDGITIEKDLYASSALTTIVNVYTFKDPANIDLLALGKSIVSQAGASGGAVVRRQDGALMGIIATATAGTTTDARELRAITIAHVNRSLKAEGEGGLVQFFNADLAGKADDFDKTTAPAERKELEDALLHR